MESEKELLFPIDTYCKSGDFYFLHHFHCQQPMYFASFLNLGLMHEEDIQVNWQFLNYDIKIQKKYGKYVDEVLSKITPEDNFHLELAQQILDVISDTYFFPYMGVHFQFEFVTNQFCNNFGVKPEPLITYNDYEVFKMENNEFSVPYEKLYKIKSTFLVLMANCINESTEKRKIIYEELKKIKNNGIEELKDMDKNNISNYIINELNKSLEISCIINNEKNIKKEIDMMVGYEASTQTDLAAAFYLPKNSNINLYSTNDNVLCIPFKYIYKFFCGKELEIETNGETIPEAKKINGEESPQFSIQEGNSINNDTFEEITKPNEQETELMKTDDISILKSSTSKNIQNSLKHRIFAGIFTIIGTIFFSIGVAAQLVSFGLPNPVSILFIVSGFIATCIGGTIFYYEDRQANKGNIFSKNTEEYINTPTFSSRFFKRNKETTLQNPPVLIFSKKRNKDI